MRWISARIRSWVSAVRRIFPSASLFSRSRVARSDSVKPRPSAISCAVKSFRRRIEVSSSSPAASSFLISADRLRSSALSALLASSCSLVAGFSLLSPPVMDDMAATASPPALDQTLLMDDAVLPQLF